MSALTRIATLAGVLAAAALLRLIALERWPVFIDEDIYACVLEQMRGGSAANWAWAPAQTGKPPLVFVLALPLARLLGSELLALRTLAALAGSLTVVGCYWLGQKVGGASVGILTAALYAFFPLAILHERMGLLDAPLGSLVLATVLSAWTAAERSSWKWALASALAGAGAVLAKQPGLLTVAVAPMLLWSAGPRRSVTANARLAGIAMAGPLSCWLGLWCSPLWPHLRQHVNERWENLTHAAQNLDQLNDATSAYLPTGLLALAVVGAAVAARQRPKLTAVLCALVVGWAAPFLAFANLSASRYYLPAGPYLLCLAAVGLLAALRLAFRTGRILGLVSAGGVAILAVSWALASLQLPMDHEHAPMSGHDDYQYRSGWPSGYGFAEARRLVDSQVGPGMSVACLLSDPHRIAAGCHATPPPGVTSLGELDPMAMPFPPEHSGDLFILTDADEPRLRELRARSTETVAVLARFTKPGGGLGPAVLRIRASAR